MTIKTWQETVGVAPDDDEYRYPCAMQDEIDELRAALAEYEKKYPKSIAECCVGQCDCDPQIEACPRCAPGLFEKGTP